MKKTNILLAGFLFVFSFSIHAQVSIEWQKSLGDTSTYTYTNPVIIKQTTDGGYIIAGSSVTTVLNQYNLPYKNYDILVIKVSNKGNIQWQETLGDPNYLEIPLDIELTTDGGYILATQNYGIIKLGASGTITWQEQYLGGVPKDIQPLSGGGYIVAGSSYSNNGTDANYWITELSAAGTVRWEESYGGSGKDEAFAIRQTNDGGYIVAGSTTSDDGDVTGFHVTTKYGYPMNYPDAWIIKLSSTGALQWQKCLGGTGEYNGEVAYAVEQTNDGGYVFAGQTTSNDGDVSGYNGGYYDGWVAKLSGAGTMQWQKCLGGSSSGYEKASSIKQTIDGGYIVTCATGADNGQVTGNLGGYDFWIVKLNSSGGLQWEKSLGSSDDEPSVIEKTTDGGYIVSGVSKSDDGDVTGKQGREDFWIVKLTAEQKLLVPATTTVTKNITGNAATDVDSLNYKLVTLTPTGGAPNALNGDVSTTTTVNSTISTFNNLPFVRRHYDITPAVNAANAQALVTLYFTQHDFDLFNAYITINNLSIPLLPTGGVDNGNLRITQFHGNFTGTSDPANYNQGTTLITPPTLLVTWDSGYNYWKVTFPVSHFSGFYLSTVDLTVLPLTLLEFKGSLKEGEVSLQWLTTDEVNTKEFIIERSNNSIEYAAIGKVSAQSTAVIHQYSFTDPQPLAGNNYYRLKMVDKDGNFTHSNIILIKINNAVSKISAYPNPLVSNTINLQFINQPKGVYKLRLINRLGQVMFTRQIPHNGNNRAEALNLNSSVQKGHYVLEIVAPDKSKHSLKIIY